MKYETEMDLSPVVPQAMLAPAPLRLLAVSFLVAGLINLFHWSGPVLAARPDFLLVILMYWTIHEPRYIGVGWGFVLGIFMDVADSRLLGQHALVFVVSVYLMQRLRLRILQLNLFEQALHAFMVLVLAQLLTVLLNLSVGSAFPGWWVVLSPVIAALLWPLINVILGLPHLRRRRSMTATLY